MLFLSRFLYATLFFSAFWSDAFAQLDTLHMQQPGLYTCITRDDEIFLKVIIKDNLLSFSGCGFHNTCKIYAGEFTDTDGILEVRSGKESLCVYSEMTGDTGDYSRYLAVDLSNMIFHRQGDSLLIVDWSRTEETKLLEDKYLSYTYEAKLKTGLPVDATDLLVSKSDTIYFNSSCGYVHSVSKSFNGRFIVNILVNSVLVAYYNIKTVYTKRGFIKRGYVIGLADTDTKAEIIDLNYKRN